MLADIDAACAAFSEEHELPGLVAGLVEEGRLLHVTALGLADREAARAVGRDTAFRIASMTKNMTSLAILSLRDAGKLALDVPVAEYLPQFAAVKPATADSRPVTLRDLMCHVAGFVTDDPWGDRVLGMTPAELDAVIAGGSLFARPPGLAFEYSNLGYALLGRVLTNVSGEPYQHYVRRTFLGPLGMARTTFDALAAARGDYAFGYRLDGAAWSRERIEPDGEVGAMGGLVTTAPDYARWVAFLLSAWPARDDPERGPVRRASVRELALYHAPPYRPEKGEPLPSAYGYGLVSSADAELGRRLHHAGGLPGYGCGVFAFANRTYAPMSKLTPRLAGIWHRATPKPAPSLPSPALRRAIDAVLAACASGRIEDVADACAVNLLLDTPAGLRNAELADLRKRLGHVTTVAALEPEHALAGKLVLACERGRLKVELVLSPEAQPGIQKLVLTLEQ